MTERNRWQLWIGFIVVSVILGAAGMAVAVASLSHVGVVVDLVFLLAVAVVIVAVWLRARRRPDLLVPPALQGLDPDSRRIVFRAVRTGARADRPDLAPAVVTQARHKETAMALLLLAWVLVVGFRALALASGDGGARAAVDLLLIVGAALAAIASLPSFLRARRAMSANSRRA